METITFKDTNETFNIMAEDDNFIICSRIYTVKESQNEASAWDTQLENYLYINHHTLEPFEKWKYSKEAVKLTNEFIYLEGNGERPTELKEDTQAYTIIDKTKKIRGADNYGNKFNYLDILECKQALKELNNRTLEISRRNSITLLEFKRSFKKDTYYSPARQRHFNLKTIKKICKHFQLTYTLDKKLNQVWFEHKA